MGVRGVGGVKRGGCGRGGGRGRGDVEGVNNDGDLHAAEAVPVSADEVVGLGLVERDEVLAGAPVAGEAVHGAVVVAGPVHLENVVHLLLVPKGCRPSKGSGLGIWRRGRRETYR